MNLSNRSKYDIGFTGFGDLALSVFTVYQAASQVYIWCNVVISVLLSVWFSDLTDLSQILIGELGWATGMFLAWF